MFGYLIDRAKRLVVGPNPRKLPRRVAVLGLILTAAVAGAGAIYFSRAGLEGAGTSSLRLLRPALELATSTWAYVAILALVTKGVILRRDEKKAEQAAAVTGYGSETVRRLAYEAESANGSTRVIATSDDEPEEIESRILEALETGEDDTFSLNPEAFEEAEKSETKPETAPKTRDDEPTNELVSIENRDEEREEKPRWRRALGSVRARVAPAAKVLAASTLAFVVWAAADLAARLVGWVLGLVGVESARLAGLAAKAWSVEGYAAAAGAGSVIVLLEWWSRRRDRERQEVTDGREESPDPWLESYKLARLDMASSLDLDALFWTVAVPAGVTVLAILVTVQLWVQPWLYPAIFAAGGLVGLLNYLRVTWMRSRRLEEVRSEREAVRWGDVAVLVKEVETPETAMFYAWLGTRRYAHENREKFASEVALRAYETVNGVQPSPSILEKQADQLEKMLPDLHAYRDDELERVMSWLLEEVRTSREGLVPKQMLIEETIEHDLNGRRINAGGSGRGFDPEIVRDAYRNLVPAALVEQEIETPEGTVTAVRHRGDPLPPSYGSIRAQFSSQFAGFARWEAMYELPDVSDQLDSEPIYADNVGYSAGSD